MGGVELLERARAAGLDVRADGERLVVRGPKAAAPLALELLAHKREILPLVADDAGDEDPPIMPPDVAWRLAAMLPRVPPRGAIPLLTARDGVVVAAAECASCGDALDPSRVFVCPPCTRASWLAIHAVREDVPLPPQGPDAGLA